LLYHPNFCPTISPAEFCDCGREQHPLRTREIVATYILHRRVKLHTIVSTWSSLTITIQAFVQYTKSGERTSLRHGNLAFHAFGSRSGRCQYDKTSAIAGRLTSEAAAARDASYTVYEFQSARQSLVMSCGLRNFAQRRKLTKRIDRCQGNPLQDPASQQCLGDERTSSRTGVSHVSKNYSS
jgi:hypothetical protein